MVKRKTAPTGQGERSQKVARSMASAPKSHLRTKKSEATKQSDSIPKKSATRQKASTTADANTRKTSDNTAIKSQKKQNPETKDKTQAKTQTKTQTKENLNTDTDDSQEANSASASRIPRAPAGLSPSDPFTVQIVTGSYDRILHGIMATITPSDDGDDGEKPMVEFADTFLFNAHLSAIRCLAISPASPPSGSTGQKVFLATGSSDERINVYHLSAHPPSVPYASSRNSLSSVTLRPVRENLKNREVGTLVHHNGPITQLAFPTRSKLLSSSEDSSVAITRARDWSLLSTIAVPKAKPVGRVVGDTAPVGATPSGVMSFAVHPSLKVMISVSRGERSMRLWNLVTGRKAGVFQFSRDMLRSVGEITARGTGIGNSYNNNAGEGQRIVWGATRTGGDEFAVAFERDVLVFGMDSRPRCRLLSGQDPKLVPQLRQSTAEGATTTSSSSAHPTVSRSKVHALRYLAVNGDDDKAEQSVLAVATEDGRILFFSTESEDWKAPAEEGAIPTALLVATLGGRAHGVTSRIKDFSVVRGPDNRFYFTTGSSDGTVRLWSLSATTLLSRAGDTVEQGLGEATLLATYPTQNRITCLDSFVMIPRPEGMEDDSEGDESESDEDEDDEE